LSKSSKLPELPVKGAVRMKVPVKLFSQTVRS